MSNLIESKEYAIKRLDKELENAKFETIKGILETEKIIIPDYIKTTKELKKYLKSNLNKEEMSIIENIFDESDKLLENTIKELKEGSTTAFTNFLSKINIIAKPLSKLAAHSLALRTIIALAPGPIEKTLISLGLTLRAGYNLNKNIKYKNVLNKNTELNKIIEELEISYDEHGRKNTRFDQKLVDNIKEFFVRNNIKYNNIGYLELRETLYNLDYETKLSIVNIINNLKGNKINIEERLKEYDGNIFTKIKKKIIKPTVIGASTGIGVATTVNAIEPAITAGLFNGTIIGKIVSNITNDKLSGFLTGTAGYAGNFFLKYIPFIGEFLENLLAYENLIASVILGGAAGLALNTIKDIGKKVKNTHTNIVANKKHIDFLKLDSEIYKEDNLKEMEARNKFYEEKEVTNEEKAIILLTKKYMQELNIKYPDNINTLLSLKGYLATLKNKDKKRIYEFLDKLDELRKNNNNYFKLIINKIGKSIYTASLISLAGLSVIDILSNGEFFTELSGIMYDNPTPIRDYDLPEFKKPEEEPFMFDGDGMAMKVEEDVIAPELTSAPTNTPTPTPKETFTPGPREKPIYMRETNETPNVPYENRPHNIFNAPPLESKNTALLPEVSAPLPSPSVTVKDTEYLSLVHQINGGGKEFIRKINNSTSSSIYYSLDLLAQNNNTSSMQIYLNNLEYKPLINLFKYMKENINDLDYDNGVKIMEAINIRVDDINKMISNTKKFTNMLANSVSTANGLIDSNEKQK